jgi:hypothetical protein
MWFARPVIHGRDVHRPWEWLSLLSRARFSDRRADLGEG